MISLTEQELKKLKMAASTSENGRKVRCLGLADLRIIMEIYMRENGIKTDHMAKVLITNLAVLYIKGSGTRTSNTVWV